jgi:leader peptidase (prepilin peptidase)/N-methyltransferase
VILVAAVLGLVGGYGAARLADVVGLARYGPSTAGHDPEDAALAPLDAPTTGPQRLGAAIVGAIGLAALAGGLPDDGEVVALFGALFLAWLAAMVVDLQFLRLPNLFTYPTAIAALVGVALLDGPPLGGALLGAVVYAGFLLVARVGYQLLRGREGMGLGDIKLALSLGATAGWLGGAYTDPGTVGSLQLVIYAALAGNLLGAVGGLVALRRVDRELPFGPALVLGWLLVVALAERLLG